MNVNIREWTLITIINAYLFLLMSINVTLINMRNEPHDTEMYSHFKDGEQRR